MVEDLGSVIGKGFETWKKNLIISLAFVLSWILTNCNYRRRHSSDNSFINNIFH